MSLRVRVAEDDHGRLQLAAVQLVEAGRLSPQSPVSEYLPEFGDCVVVEDSHPVVDLLARTDSANATEPKPITKFSPAKGVMKVEHLMHYTSGLFYPFDALPDWDKDLDGPYSMEHDPVDPVGAFVRAIKVYLFCIFQIADAELLCLSGRFTGYSPQVRTWNGL